LQTTPATAFDALQRTASTYGDERGIRYYPTLEQSEYCGFAELDRRARAIAHALRAHGLAVGDRAIIALSPGLGWAEAVFGAMYAGVAFVPAPIAGFGAGAALADKVAALTRAAEGAVIITDDAVSAAIDGADLGAPALLLADLRTTGDALEWTAPSIGSDAIAWLFFTSGSTGDPKGVIGTHGALVATAEAAAELIGADADSTLVGWLPLHHAMGLVMQVLVPGVNGGQSVLTTTEQFQRRPLSWLQLMSYHKATVSLAGNFAFDLCTKFATDEQVAELDLSSIRALVSGSEPVRPATVAAFVERFAPAGLDPTTIAPAFGMTEAMFITAKPLGVPYTITSVDPEQLGVGKVVASDQADAAQLVSCGVTASATTLRIVDPETLTALGEGTIGEVWISSPSVSPGYFRRPDATAETFGFTLAGDARSYVRTGDLGALVDDEIYITGRLKDLIILRGRNIHPSDIEAAASALSPALGVSAAFELSGAGAPVGIIVEFDADISPVAGDELLERIRDELARTFSLPAVAVGLVSVGDVPRTPTGKIRRAPARSLVLAGDLEFIHATGFDAVVPASVS
jgi:acyl-CoA synthetase (AMP-forming)/AMP-acid ligase II